MKYLNPLDAAFVRMESKRTPMHVAGLLVFKLPEDAPPDFVSRLFEHMRSQPVVTPPFNFRLAQSRRARLVPYWEPVDAIDIDYHLRHSALPHPGGERELGVLVSRLHSNPMDLELPLWECHLIEGLENRRFAVYFKTHHAAVDGITALRMVKNWLSTDPEADTGSGPWAIPPPLPDPNAPLPPRRQPRDMLRYGVHFAEENLRGAGELGRALKNMFRSESNPDGGMGSPLDTPRTLFNTRITPHRRVATQRLELDRFKRLSKATGTTINDLCLAACGGGIRRYLIEHDALPEKSLLASVPIGLPRPDGQSGNRVAGFICPIGTDIDDPVRRLERIHAITTHTKDEMKRLSDAALGQFSALGISPLMLGQMSGLILRLPPLFNLTLSNVAASRDKLYFQGAELEAMYPISVLFDGHALNMTVVGYADHLLLGVTGCRETIPNLQRLAVYTGEALPELEAAAGVAAKAKRRKSVSRRGRGRAAKTV